MSIASRRDRNKELTRRGILRAARRLFSRHGYTDTPLNSVVQAAKVTTGAVYHHFGDKKGLFRAVAEDVEAEILKRVIDETRDTPDPWSRLLIGTLVMLDICSEPEIRRIIFIDAPNVIGGAEWREIELRYGYGAMRRTLAELVAAGKIRALSVDILAPMLLGSMIEAANSVASAQDKPAALRDAKEAVLIFAQALRAP